MTITVKLVEADNKQNKQTGITLQPREVPTGKEETLRGNDGGRDTFITAVLGQECHLAVEKVEWGEMRACSAIG